VTAAWPSGSLTESGCQCESKPEVRLAHQPTVRGTVGPGPPPAGATRRGPENPGDRAVAGDFQVHCEPRSNSGLLNR
jgi:hypothetical protein